jgi:hypothetical protein
MRSAARHVGDSLREGSGLPRPEFMSALAAKHSSLVFVGGALFRRRSTRRRIPLRHAEAIVPIARSDATGGSPEVSHGAMERTASSISASLTFRP